jgi:hypothetical protein
MIRTGTRKLLLVLWAVNRERPLPSTAWPSPLVESIDSIDLAGHCPPHSQQASEMREDEVLLALLLTPALPIVEPGTSAICELLAQK